MRNAEIHWQQVEEYLRHDERAVLPHAFLSLSTDSILAEQNAGADRRRLELNRALTP